jgi:transposase-like protein
MPDREEPRRKQAIARDLADDKIADICKAIGGSKSWLYKWRDRYQADDPHWAKELTRRPRTTPANTPQTIEQAVVSLRRALCHRGQGCGAAAIQQGLAPHGLEPVPSQRTIYRMLHRHQKEVPETPKRLRSVPHLGNVHPAMLRLFPP